MHKILMILTLFSFSIYIAILAFMINIKYTTLIILIS